MALMTRQAPLVLLAALLALPVPGASAAPPLQQVLPSVVSVLPEWPPDARRNEEPEGSGVVIADGKTVLTAAHVVAKALSIQVRTWDGELIEATLRARDMATDLAILGIEQQLRPIAISRQEPQLGEPVCAIGNAFGLGLSTTCGVVSGLHRAGVGFNRIEDFVQTDAAVNPGASGGALVNARGEMVGLLSAIFTKASDSNIGVNFAVSAVLADHVANALIRDGRVKRTISGLRLIASPAKGETGRQGARVEALKPGALGEKAGIKPGDVIYRAGGRRIRKPADFVSVMAGFDAVGSLEVEIERGSETLTLRLEK